MTTKTDTNGNTRIRDIGIIAIVLVLALLAYILFYPAQQVPARQPADKPEVVAHSGEGMMGDVDGLPEDFESLVNTGNRYMDDGNYAVAAESYRRALAIDSSDNDVRTDFGACLHAMGLVDRAIEEFQKVLAVKPNHGIAHFNLGIVYYQQDQYDSARVYWQKYLTLEPDGRAAKMARELLREIDG